LLLKLVIQKYYYACVEYFVVSFSYFVLGKVRRTSQNIPMRDGEDIHSLNGKINQFFNQLLDEFLTQN